MNDKEELTEKQIEDILYRLGLPIVEFIRNYLSKEHAVNIDSKTITLWMKDKGLLVDEINKPNIAIRKQISVEYFILGEDNMPEWFSNGLTDYGTVKFDKDIKSGSSAYKVLVSDDTWKDCYYGDVVVLDEYGVMDVFDRKYFDKNYEIQK